ncbi:hypothetical protein GE09DRAFT_616213 [Coniochaeta sp. 2T2.1]|nr:hypothetical protein GE09DRAFT_616213 [Coniochaeta sp. 2T2.1]
MEVSSTSFARELIQKLQARPPSDPAAELPYYNAADALDVDLLVTTSTPAQVRLGTGADIYTTTLIPAILTARSEVILVTCFWAKSKTLSALGDALNTLASHRKSLIARGDHVAPLRMHICFSSRSLFQKLFHTSSRNGYTYPQSSWHETLGLPAAEAFQAGHIELQVKTLFFLPFSVMHPKFLIIDRQTAFLPSCNVSWEAWLEGCVEISGPAVWGLLDFFSRTWNIRLEQLPPLSDGAAVQPAAGPRPSQDPILSSVHHCKRSWSTSLPIPTLILPSSHHRNPRFRLFPWQVAAPPPPTPLNVALIQLIDSSLRSIYIQTPNLTCAPVISALLDALSRGVNVTIVTSRNMMLIEQLLTAGTTTGWCLRSLVRRYRSMVLGAAAHPQQAQRAAAISADTAQHSVTAGPPDLEAQLPVPGQLRVSYFRARPLGKPTGPEQQHLALPGVEEPVHSHFKLTIVEEEYTVLGSGNMDRASWYTSQELGILFRSKEFAAAVRDTVSEALVGRLDAVFDGP